MTSIPMSGRAEAADTRTPARPASLARAAQPRFGALARTALTILDTVLKALWVWLAYVGLVIVLTTFGVPALVSCAVGVVAVMAAAWRLGMFRSA